MTHATTEAARRDALDWLYGRINYETRTAIPYSEQGLKLDRARELARRVGDPQDGLRIVHIAGTKGKGSTAAMIAAALEAGGYTTGVYSSPHFDRLEERFAVGGAPCTAEELVTLIEQVREAAEAMDRETGGHGPTFFDLTTVMALRHFADRRVDAVVLEVGLGGRLDSTNIVSPLVSVITSISLDHTEQLGDTLEKIAAEKAGILKPGVPAVSGVTDPGPAGVIQRIAEEHGCRLLQRDRDYAIEPSGGAWRYKQSLDSDTPSSIKPIEPALPGMHQAENAAAALATLQQLERLGLPTTTEAKQRGVATGRLPGRMERFAGEPTIVVDGAHNDASAAALAEVLDDLCGPAPIEKRVLVIAISSDKDARAVLSPLVGRFGGVIATRFLENPRALAPEALVQLITELSGRPCPTAADPAAALQHARRLAGPEGAVVFAGSLLFAAEVRRLIID